MSARGAIYPKDSTAGRVVLAVVAPLVGVGAFGIKSGESLGRPVWAYALLGLALLITLVFKMFWDRGYFGHTALGGTHPDPSTDEEAKGGCP